MAIYEIGDALAGKIGVPREDTPHPIFMKNVEVACSCHSLSDGQRRHVFGPQLPLDGGKVRADSCCFANRGQVHRRAGRDRRADEHRDRENDGVPDSCHDGLLSSGEKNNAAPPERRGGSESVYFMMIIFFVNRRPSTTSW
jgi:hypothetical protein